MTESEVLPSTAAARTLAAVAVAARVPRWSWRRTYLASLVIGDLLGVLLAVTAVRLAGVDGSSHIATTRYAAWLVAAVLVLLSALYATGGYEIRRIAVAVEEGRRLFHGTAITVGVLAVAALLAQITLARRVVLIDVAAMLAGLLFARWLVRLVARSRRRHGQWCDRVLAAGSAAGVADLIHVLQRRPTAGLTVVAACLTDDRGPDPLPVPVIGAWSHITAAAADVDADVVAIAGGGKGARAARELGWALEGTGRQLVTALELSDVARSRIDVRPVDGVPLAWVGHPHFAGPTRLVKRIVDVVGATVALVLASPVLLVAAVLVKTTSPGPMFFKQQRLGKNGKLVSVLKFRTMITDAEARRDELVEQNIASNLLYFKVHNDPRMTRVGATLRRFSIDELPQLINVLLGSMSMVGPRPLPGDLDGVDSDYRRRLLVKPGLTGLWQVSGRNDLPAEEALRLDLYYVENWSLGLDLALIVRTVWAVLRKQGAY